MKKNKDSENPTASRLVEMAKERHKDVERKAIKTEAENQKRISGLTLEEKRLKTEIATGKELLEQMIEEFETLRQEKKEAISAEIRQAETTKKDVQDGKASLIQFQSKGLTDEAVKKIVLDSTSDSLEKARDTIRAKGEEIVRLELALSEAQSSVYQLMLTPVRSLLTSYVQLQDMLNYQLGPLSAEGNTAQSNKMQKENELTLIEKQASVMSSGFIWSNISLKEAYCLELNPIMPKKHILSLLEQLSEIEPSEETRLTVTYHQPGSYWPGLPVEVREELPAPPSMSKLKIESKPVKTND